MLQLLLFFSKFNIKLNKLLICNFLHLSSRKCRYLVCLQIYTFNSYIFVFYCLGFVAFFSYFLFPNEWFVWIYRRNDSSNRVPQKLTIFLCLKREKRDVKKIRQIPGKKSNWWGGKGHFFLAGRKRFLKWSVRLYCIF